jgi:ABC-type Fe3+/spermidine/putrescine transport system ATPase subunit
MSDRVAVFSDGRIQQAATPTELYENAQNAFVANFVGENNGLTGRVVNASEDWATLALSDGSVIRGRCELGLSAGDEAMLALRPSVRISRARKARTSTSTATWSTRASRNSCIAATIIACI